MSFWDRIGEGLSNAWDGFKSTVKGVGDSLGDSWRAFTGEANVQAQKDINEKQIAFEREMYARQRADSLSDWNMVNQYNSPEQVMNRYRQAGLNPNLIYGKGADGTAGMVRSSSVNTSVGQAPQYTNGGPLGAILGVTNQIRDIMDMRFKQAQTDNINQITANNQTKGIALGLDNINKQIKNEKDEATKDVLTKIKDSMIERYKVETATTWAKNEQTNLDLSFKRDFMYPLQYELTKQQYENLKKLGQSKDFMNDALRYEKELRDKSGLSPTSAKYIQMLADFVLPFLGPMGNLIYQGNRMTGFGGGSINHRYPSH